MLQSFYGIAVLTEVTKQLVWSSTVVVIVWNMELLFGFLYFPDQRELVCAFVLSRSSTFQRAFNCVLMLFRLCITKLCVYHCGGGQGEKYARVAYPEQKLKYYSDTWKEGKEKKRESDWNDKWIQDQSECKIFIMLTVSPSSLSGSFPPFEN